MADEPAGADLGILLTLALRAFVDQLHGELDERGFAEVRTSFGVVFRALREQPLTLTDLAARLGVTKQAAAKVVDEMVELRLVRRRTSPTDARAKLLDLTPRGRRAMAAAMQIGEQIDVRLADRVGRRAVHSMHTALEAFIVQAGLGDDLARRRSPAVWSD
jgi:DNA-binding MarR family transcriptional regulator